MSKTAQALIDFNQIKILADAKRLRLVRRLMAGSASLAELGRQLHQTPAHVRHHLKALEQAGLVKLDSTRRVHGFTEKRYRATAQAYRIHLTILPARLPRQPSPNQDDDQIGPPEKRWSRESPRTFGPAPQSERQFCGDSLTGVITDDNQPYVPLRRLCDRLGLSARRELRHIKRSVMLTDRLKRLPVAAADGDVHRMLCLPVDLIPEWLAGVSVSEAKNGTLKEKVLSSQQNLRRAIWAVLGPKEPA